MKYVSIDLETTGLDPEEHQIIEFAAVAEDTARDTPIDQLPVFHAYLHHETIRGHLEALAMNDGILKAIRTLTPALKNSGGRLELKREDDWVTQAFLNPIGLVRSFVGWVKQNVYGLRGEPDELTKFTVAGKNFATFDLLFLQQWSGWNNLVQIRRRILDPTVMFLGAEDEVPPDLQTCLDRAGIDVTVPHRAVDDARLVIRLIRAGTAGRQVVVTNDGPYQTAETVKDTYTVKCHHFRAWGNHGGGKWYTEGEYEVPTDWDMFQIRKDIKERQVKKNLPGLSAGGDHGWYHTFFEVPGHPHDHPMLVLAPLVPECCVDALHEAQERLWPPDNNTRVRCAAKGHDGHECLNVWLRAPHDGMDGLTAEYWRLFS